MTPKSLQIEKMAFGGAGFGRYDGKACFIPYTARGDVIEFDVVADKKSYLSGKLRDIVLPSPLRVTPPCPVFGACGGCQWQHLPYSEQLNSKQEIFTELLTRIARLEPEVIEPIVGSTEQFGYRTRIQLKVRYISGVLHLGFYRAGSHFVVDIPEHCPITRLPINRLIPRLYGLLSTLPEPDKVPQVDAAAGEDGRVLLTFHYIGGRLDETISFLEKNSHALPEVEGIWLQSGRKASLVHVTGGTALSYCVPDSAGRILRLIFSRGGFSQVNLQQNVKLVETVLEWLQDRRLGRVLDIFCGNGNFSLPLASAADAILGIEGYQPSIDDARENSLKNGIQNAEYVCADAAEGIGKVIERGEYFHTVILDPPRDGARDIVAKLITLKPQVIIYVSCDPATLARDLSLLRKGGYAVVKSRPFDMFPQTYHIESISMLTAVSDEEKDYV
ncbi:23S rRNA (uracil(1939)-C(5))-methyltransferase RlmD [Geobacter sp. DSM 9736]|uniref:23S rRNA (uracil(1939)-C(5))-methyltransferase RlmD n=1 Tax=Geobacter sp. DSM 9736 TaxID=1277350 RepID=UPI000B4FEAAE|nr:23S rRNA (uracil(1939)-C(5))-methyltransferase RlmD [Geobacter sp. DSM 9736]SNB45609.1 23S rRNA m(5)U-1939 methyltransferase [Geobacter sp. DSM 9736]